jgi:hypothetical protein
MRKLATLFSSLINSPIQIFSGATFKKGLNSLLEVYGNTVAGDLVIVASGSYDLGSDSILLKNGVNWDFKPGVTITSSSANGTFKDGGSVITTHWFGKPTLANTNAFKNRIKILATSSIKGFTDICILKFDEFQYDGGWVGKIYSVFSDLGDVTPYYDGGDAYLDFDSHIANNIDNYAITHTTDDGNQVPNKLFSFSLKENDYVPTKHCIGLVDLNASGYLMNGITLTLTLFYTPRLTIFNA